jgi:hypothetical protein
VHRIIRSVLAVPAAAGFLLATSAAGATTAATAYRAGSCTAQGEYADCVADGNATDPVKIYVHVTSDPDQQVSAYWDMVCTKGDGAGSSSGQFTANTPTRHLIHHPYKHPDSCSIGVSAGLNNGGGHLKVWISYRR